MCIRILCVGTSIEIYVALYATHVPVCIRACIGAYCVNMASTPIGTLILNRKRKTKI